jgi:hypothetical protein
VATFEKVTEAEEAVEEFTANHDPNFTSET